MRACVRVLLRSENANDCAVQLAVLISGIMFQSGHLYEGSVSYFLLTIVVACVLLGSTGLFIGLVAWEMRNVFCRTEPRLRPSAAARGSPGGSVESWTATPPWRVSNPLYVKPRT